jgi:uncharacterized protein YciI
MAKSPPTRRYLVVFSRGENWREGVLFKDQLEYVRHDEYMASRRRLGQLIRAVPLTDASGSIALFLGQSLEEVRQFVEDDPMVQAGVMQADLYTWEASIPA